MTVKCSGTNRQGGPCQLNAINGGTVCWRHGGKAPQTAAKAAVRAELMSWGLDSPLVDPGETLLKLVSQSAARAQRYSQEIERLVDDSPSLHEALVAETWIPTETAGSYKAGEYIRGLAVLEAQERDRCAGFCAKAIAAGLAERVVRVAEQQASIAERALIAALDDLGLTGEQRQQALGRLAHHLRLAG